MDIVQQMVPLSRCNKLLGNPVILSIIVALGNRRYTLPALCRRLGKSKSLLCTYLGQLHRAGIVEKGEVLGRLRYWLKRRDIRLKVRRDMKMIREEPIPVPVPRSTKSRKPRAKAAPRRKKASRPRKSP